MAGNKNSIAVKMQKNPFVFVGIIMLVVILLISIFAVSSSVKKSLEKSNAETTETESRILVPTQAKAPEETTEPSKNTELTDIKTYADGINSVTADFEKNRTAVNVSFKDSPSLYNSFGVNAKSKTDGNCYFVFYLNENTVLKLPCEKYIAKDNVNVTFYLYDIDDYKTVLSLTDSLNIDYGNILSSRKFNIVFENKNGDVKTVLGNADFEFSKTKESDVNTFVKGIKKVEIIKEKEFAWVDIYYTDESNYQYLNRKFENNFIGFTFDTSKGTKDYLFSVTRYDGLNMLRCKFDSYALEQINSEFELNCESVSDFLRNITVYSSNYDSKTDLFSF